MTVVILLLFAGAGSPVLANNIKASHNIVQKAKLTRSHNDNQDDLVGGIISLVRTGVQIVDRTSSDGIASDARLSFLSVNTDDIISLNVESGSTYHFLLLYPHHKFR